MGLAISVAVFLASVLAAGSFMHAAKDLLVERVKQSLQNQLDDETISTVEAKRFLDTVPPGSGNISLVDRDRVRELIRSRGELEATFDSTAVDGGDGESTRILEERANELVREVRVASAACALLFGVAFGLFFRPAHEIDTSPLAAPIAACGATLIGSAYSSVLFLCGTATQGCAGPAILVAASVVLILVADALFNSFRATRAILDWSRFWP
jgi:hypothetical protein